MVKEAIRSDNFIRQLKKIDKSYLEQIEKKNLRFFTSPFFKIIKLVIKIINNPEIGKPMRFDKKGTREVYLSPFILSYAYDRTKDVLYFLDIYHKKGQ